jgi:acyl carrier protein
MTAIPTRAEILKDISMLLGQQMGIGGATPIDEGTRFFADLGLASIDAVVLGEALVQYYRRPIPFKELMAEIGRRTERDLSIGELVSFLEAHLGD